MAHMVETMAYNVKNGTPWHKLGISVIGAMTAEEALKAASLDWKVTKEAVYTNDGIVIPEKWVTMRSADRKPLGIVGDTYTIVQNDEAMEIGSILTRNHGAIFDTAISLKGGKVIALCMEVPNGPIAKEDYKKYLLIVNSHDGSKKLQVVLSAVRTVCWNTMNFAISKADTNISIRHTAQIENKIQQAKVVLAKAHTYFHKLDETMTNLKSVKMSVTQTKEVIESLFPQVKEDKNDETSVLSPADILAQVAAATANKINQKPLYSTRSQNSIDQILKLVDHGKGVNLPGVHGTAYGVLNAVGEYADHYMSSRATTMSQEENKAESILFGAAAALKQNAYNTLSQMVQMS